MLERHMARTLFDAGLLRRLAIKPNGEPQGRIAAEGTNAHSHIMVARVFGNRGKYMKASQQVVAFLVFWCLCTATIAQETNLVITPERVGFSHRNVGVGEDSVQYYVSSGGVPLQGDQRRPLVLYLDGSGPSPLYYRGQGGIGSSLMFDAADFKGYHLAVISKPGIPFFSETKRVASVEYDQRQSLRWRVEAAKAVIEDLVAEGIVDKTRVLVLGHSEGSDVAPWVGLESPHVTHVAALAPGGLSLMFDYIALTRRKIASGDMSQAEGERLIQSFKEDFRTIYSDSQSTERRWSGEVFKRWSTFFRPAMDAWRQLDKPVYLGICRDDQNTAVESGEAIELEFIRLGKLNYKSRIWPCDHYMIDASKADATADLRLEVLGEVLEWASCGAEDRKSLVMNQSLSTCFSVLFRRTVSE